MAFNVLTFLSNTSTLRENRSLNLIGYTSQRLGQHMMALSLGGLMLSGIGIPAFAQNQPLVPQTQSPTSEETVQPASVPNMTPILKLSPEAPSQWQTPLSKQSTTALPPLPSSEISVPANEAGNTKTTQKRFVLSKAEQRKAEQGKTEQAKPSQAESLKQPQSELQFGQSANTALTVGANTQRIPAGTFLNVRFNTTMDSKITPAGEPFTATILEDFTANQQVILPVGTLVRGRVEQVKRPSFFSKGGSIFLTFDHVVLPTGDIMPLDLKLSTQNAQVTPQGGIYQDPGIPKKLGQSVNKGVGVFQKITESGIQTGKNTADGFGSIVTVPLAVVGGAIAGTAVTTGNTAVAIVGKGESAVIQPGDTVRIDFGGAFNLPSN
ncbi:MAG: hypothetical protein VKJ04_10385 [Vampirovibrionales bacterium]|nr:hypothetical protein [Vampirovibrionales bacterium]